MKKILLKVYDFIYNFFLSRKHKKNIRKSRDLIKKIQKISSEEFGFQKSLSYLRKIDPFLFEELIMSCFENYGYRVKRNKRYTGDGGFDGNVFIDGELHGIQCKRYEGYINKKHVEEFAVLCEKGFFVHTGKTGEKSREVFKDTSIKIISGENLINFITMKKRLSFINIGEKQ